MRPRADEVLQSAIWSYDTYVLPEVQEPFAKSIALTVGNLLRHVSARIEDEGQAIFDDIVELRECLEATRLFVQQLPPGSDAGELSDLPSLIEGALGTTYVASGQYPSLRLVTEEALALRATLDACIRSLQRSRPSLGDMPAYRDLRRRIRLCVRHELERQRTWDTDALIGERR